MPHSFELAVLQSGITGGAGGVPPSALTHAPSQIRVATGSGYSQALGLLPFPLTRAPSQIPSGSGSSQAPFLFSRAFGGAFGHLHFVPRSTLSSATGAAGSGSSQTHLVYGRAGGADRRLHCVPRSNANRVVPTHDSLQLNKYQLDLRRQAKKCALIRVLTGSPPRWDVELLVSREQGNNAVRLFVGSILSIAGWTRPRLLLCEGASISCFGKKEDILTNATAVMVNTHPDKALRALQEAPGGGGGGTRNGCGVVVVTDALNKLRTDYKNEQARSSRDTLHCCCTGCDHCRLIAEGGTMLETTTPRAHATDYVTRVLRHLNVVLERVSETAGDKIVEHTCIEGEAGGSKNRCGKLCVMCDADIKRKLVSNRQRKYKSKASERTQQKITEAGMKTAEARTRAALLKEELVKKDGELANLARVTKEARELAARTKEELAKHKQQASKRARDDEMVLEGSQKRGKTEVKPPARETDTGNRAAIAERGLAASKRGLLLSKRREAKAKERATELEGKLAETTRLFLRARKQARDFKKGLETAKTSADKKNGQKKSCTKRVKEKELRQLAEKQSAIRKREAALHLPSVACAEHRQRGSAEVPAGSQQGVASESGTTVACVGVGGLRSRDSLVNPGVCYACAVDQRSLGSSASSAAAANGVERVFKKVGRIIL